MVFASIPFWSLTVPVVSGPNWSGVFFKKYGWFPRMDQSCINILVLDGILRKDRHWTGEKTGIRPVLVQYFVPVRYRSLPVLTGLIPVFSLVLHWHFSGLFRTILLPVQYHSVPFCYRSSTVPVISDTGPLHRSPNTAAAY